MSIGLNSTTLVEMTKMLGGLADQKTVDKIIIWFDSNAAYGEPGAFEITDITWDTRVGAEISLYSAPVEAVAAGASIDLTKLIFYLDSDNEFLADTSITEGVANTVLIYVFLTMEFI